MQQRKNHVIYQKKKILKPSVLKKDLQVGVGALKSDSESQV